MIWIIVAVIVLLLAVDIVWSRLEIRRAERRK